MIELKSVSRIFQAGDQEVRALDEVNLTINSGDYLSIMGPSGSGKSTLLNIIGLLDKPNSGTCLLNNKDVTTLSDNALAHIRRKKTGFIFQFFQLLPRLTAQENVELPMMLEGVRRTERQSRAIDSLTAVGLADRALHKPEELSGGQRQRVAIARATVMSPDVILADEPTGNLDQASGHEVINIIEGLNKKGMSLIVVTHDPTIGHRASRQIRMVDGRIEKEQAVSHAQ